MRTATALGFLAGALMVVVALHLVGGVKLDTSDKWMGPLLQAPIDQPYRVHLFGTSRVAAALDAEVVEKTLADSGWTKPRSINLGMGYSQISEYYFAARHVLRSRPDAFRGSVVLLEAPMGLPEYSTFRDNWMVEEAYSNLGGYLELSDLPSFLRQSHSTALSKAQVAGWVVFGYRERFSRLRYHVTSAILKALSSEKPSSQPEPSSDLTTAGGIRVDSAGVMAVRKIALAHVREVIKNQTPHRDWDSTTLHAFVSLMQGAGARVVLYSIPLSPTQAMPLLTPVRLQDKASLDSALVRWKVPMLHPPMSVDEFDFPDYMHLRRSRAGEFSTKLAQSLVERERAAPTAP